MLLTFLFVVACMLGLLVINKQRGQGVIVKEDKSGNRAAGFGDIGRSMGPEGYAAIILEQILTTEEVKLPADVLRPWAVELSPAGVKTIMTSEYTSGTRLVELHFMGRELNGEINPVSLNFVQLQRAGAGEGPRGFQMDGGKALRLGIGQDGGNMRSVLLGGEYLVTGYAPSGVNAVVKGPVPCFRIPEDLAKGALYRVQLLLVDKIHEQIVLEQQAAEARRKKELEEKEKITIHVRKYPEGATEGSLVAGYYDGVRAREFSEHGSIGELALKGPNKLGGELVVYFTSKATGEITTWAYVKEVQKRVVDLPDDADLEITDKDLIEVYLSFEGQEQGVLESLKGVALYAGADAKWPLFMARLTSREELDYNRIGLRLVPGSYYLRGHPKKGKEILLGKLQVDKQVKTYRLGLPSLR
jgi:hypothetical protein